MNKYAKFAALIVVVVLGIGYIALQAMPENQTYYKTVAELTKMGDKAYNARLRVGGDVEPGSIQRVGNSVQFVIVQDNSRLKISYVGTDPLPDTFKDGAQALADGKLLRDNVFETRKISAKCASKYEAKPGMKPGQAIPNVNSGKSSI